MNAIFVSFTRHFVTFGFFWLTAGGRRWTDTGTRDAIEQVRRE